MAHMAFNNIQVGIDGSDCAVAALGWAARFAEESRASLTALAAWQVPVAAMMAEAAAALVTDEAMAAQAESLMTAAIAAVDDDLGDRVERVVLKGAAGPTIAERTGADTLVVLGRHGSGQHGPLDRLVDLVIGSTAHYVIHHAAGPVAVVPDGAAWVESPKVRVGVDGSPASLSALSWAIDNLGDRADLTATYTTVPFAGDPMVPVDASFTPTVLAAAETELASWVDTARDTTERPDRPVATAVEVGAARYALTNPDLGADLIVVGHRGRTGLARVLGSVADHVVRHAQVPVIVVR